MASDLEFSVRLTVPQVQVSRGGAIVLPVARFNSILRESTDEKLTIDANDRGVVVKGDRSEFRFPSINARRVSQRARLQGREVPRGGGSALQASDPANRVCHRYRERPLCLWAVSCSKWKVARSPRWERTAGGSPRWKARPKRWAPQHADSQTIVRTASMRLLGRAISDGDEKSTSRRGATTSCYERRGRVFHSRLVEGRFPRWRDVIPRGRRSKDRAGVEPFSTRSARRPFWPVMKPRGLISNSAKGRSRCKR